ncbi:hypothetical protein FRC20_001845 [Serendipita sp. 405]|nr:hypothetical protein FRC20_001845 [Serendipita sp. 405]
MAKNIAHLKTRLKNHGGKSKGGKGGMGRSSSGGGAGAAWAAGSGSDSDVGRKNTSNKNAKQKSKRTWGDVVPTEEDMSALDFSEKSPLQDESSMTNAISPGLLDSLVDSSSKGEKKGGVYEIRDWEFEKKKSSSSSKKEAVEEEDDEDDMEDFISRTLQEASLDGTPGGGGAQQPQQQDQPGYFSSLFSRLTGLAGTTRPLTQQDLAPVLAGMKEHLMKKNVAREIAERVCDGVGKSLEGKKVGGLKSIRGEVKNALEESITRILTPKSSTDILHAIRLKKSTGAGTGAGGGIGIGIGAGGGGNVKVKGSDPYSLTFVGVNGVGKSTNLSKVAFWLLQNDFRVLIAACDTFRSGAVEQLRVHVRNLGMLVDREREEEAAEERNEGGKGEKEKKEKRIELYERGYGKDAAGIAKDAIAYAKESGFDVVLIDTAGRMQDNEPLMRALAKLVAINQPDKIVFVGEALVGNEAVDQLVKFDRALRDFTSGGGKGGGGGGGGASASGGQAGGGSGRGIDGMLVTKWDTVDDKVGAALSMTYVTGQPILFVGCGQTYTDLRQLRVSNVVQAVLDFPRRIAHPPTPPVPRVGTVRSFKLTPCYLVSLQDVVAGRHLPPLGRKEFEDFLYFKEYSVENLYFYIWFNQYQAEWTQWAKRVQKEGRSIDSNGTLLAHTNTNTSEDQTHEDEQDEKKKKKKSGSNENSTRNGRVSSSSLDDAQPDRHLAMSYLRAKQTFFTPGSRWELNLPQKTLQLLLHPPEGQRHPGPRSHPHPSAFASVRFDVENYLNASLSRFIVQNGGNAGRQRGAFAVIVGLLAIGLGLLPIILTSLPYTPSGPNNPINNNHPNATMSPPHRPWSTRLERLSSIPPLWLGFATLIAGLHGVCVVIFLFGDARQLYPYELKRPSISSPIACAPTLAMNPNLIANGADQRRHQRLHRKRRRGDGDDGRKRLSVGVVAVPGHEQGQGRGAAARGPPHVQGGETFAVERESGREEGRAHFIAHVNLDGRRRRRGGVNAGVDSSATSDANSRTVEGEGEGEEEADVGRQGGYKRQSLYESAEDDEEEEEGEEEDEEEEEDDVFGVGRGKGSSGKARSRSPSRSTSHSVGFELEDHHRRPFRISIPYGQVPL